MTNVNWNVSKTEYAVIVQIARRAVALAEKWEFEYDQLTAVIRRHQRALTEAATGDVRRRSHQRRHGRFRRAPKAKPALRVERYQRVIDRLMAWERKKKRAETAIKKLRKQARYYERDLNSTVVLSNDTVH